MKLQKDFVSFNSTKTNIGPAGTYTLVDTSRCFHFGARTFEAERLQLICTFHYLTEQTLEKQICH